MIDWMLFITQSLWTASVSEQHVCLAPLTNEQHGSEATTSIVTPQAKVKSSQITFDV